MCNLYSYHILSSVFYYSNFYLIFIYSTLPAPAKFELRLQQFFGWGNISSVSKQPDYWQILDPGIQFRKAIHSFRHFTFTSPGATFNERKIIVTETRNTGELTSNPTDVHKSSCDYMYSHSNVNVRNYFTVILSLEQSNSE